MVLQGPARKQQRCLRNKREPSVPFPLTTFKLGASLRFVSSSVFTQASMEASSSKEPSACAAPYLPAPLQRPQGAAPLTRAEEARIVVTQAAAVRLVPTALIPNGMLRRLGRKSPPPNRRASYNRLA